MLNPSDPEAVTRAFHADPAQSLRGRAPFGGIAFHEGDAPAAEVVVFQAGYADCLPVRGGACWRDPSTIDLAETLR